MTAINHAERYGLSQYVEDDHPPYAGDCYGDVSKVDAAVYASSLAGGTGGWATVAYDGMLSGGGGWVDGRYVVRFGCRRLLSSCPGWHGP